MKMYGKGNFCPKCYTELIDENVRLCSRRDGRTWRACRTCLRDNDKRYVERSGRKKKVEVSQEPVVVPIHPAVLLFREELAKRRRAA